MERRFLRSARCDEPLDVLREHVCLEVHVRAGLEPAEGRHLQRVRDERDCEGVVTEIRDRQRDAVHGDGSLLDAVAEHIRGSLDPHTPAVPLRLDRPHAADAVDVPLHVVAAERLTRPHRGLDVHLGTEALGARLRLRHDVEREPPVPVGDDGQADAVERHRVPDPRLDGRLDHEPRLVKRRDARPLPNDSGEHG